jgi:hypothetical protein
MFKLDIVNLYDTTNNYSVVRTLKQGDYLDVNIKLDVNNPHQMIIVINPNMNFWDEFINGVDSELYGIRYRTDTLDHIFIKRESDVDEYGRTTVSMLSTSYKLATFRRDLKDLLYKGDLATFLGKYPGEFEFTNISTAKNITIETGTLSHLELLTEACTYPEFYGWRENGIVDSGGGVLKTEILYGYLGQDIEAYFNSSSDPRCEPVKTYSFNSSPSDDLNIATLKGVQRKKTGELYTHILPIGDNGSATAKSSSVRLTNPYASYINPQYPLVPLNNTETNEIDYYVLNPNARFPVPRCKDYVYTYSINEFDQSGQAKLTQDEYEEILYKKTVAYIQSLEVTFYNEIDVDLRKAVLPGNNVEIRFLQKNEKGDIIHNIDEVQTLQPYEYSLNTIQN